MYKQFINRKNLVSVTNLQYCKIYHLSYVHVIIPPSCAKDILSYHDKPKVNKPQNDLPQCITKE